MRSIFTLAGILVVVAVMMYSFMKTEIPVAQRGQEARKEAEQLAGREADGTAVADHMSLEGHSTNGKLDSILVKDITVGGAMQKYYGLQKDDQIIEVGPIAVKDNNDPDLAIALVQQAYQQKQQLVVMRDGQRVVLAGDAPAGGTAVGP